MRKFILAGLAIALALILSLDTPRPAAAQMIITGSVSYCKTAMQDFYDRLNPPIHEILLVAARKSCDETKGAEGNVTTAVRYVMKDAKLPDIPELLKIQKVFDARFTGKKAEPGLVKMAGKLLREAARTEAVALYSAIGAKRKQEWQTAENKRVADFWEAKRLRQEAFEREKAECEKNLPPLEPGQAQTQFCMSALFDSSTLPAGPPAPDVNQAYKAYADKYIALIQSNPDMALGIKLLLYNTLFKIINAGAKTPGEKEFLANMREYVRQANIDIAVAAEKAYEDWEEEQALIRANRGRMGNHPFIQGMDFPVPPDFEQIAGNAIMGSALAIGTAAMIATSVATSSVALAATLGDLALTTGTSLWVATSSMSAFAAAGATAFTMVAGSIAIIAVAITIGVVVAINMTDRDKAIAQIKTAKDRASLPVDLKTYFNTPEKTNFLQLMFAKATSVYSPTGRKDAAVGCQACFYEHNNYTGKKFCTTGRIHDLHALKFAPGDNFNFGDEISSVSIDNKNCKGAYVTIYQDDNFQGEKTNLGRSYPALGPLNWNDEISSVRFYNSGATKCEVCLHKDSGYKGGFFCSNGPIKNLDGLGWSDEASAITFDKRDCPRAKLWLYEDENFGGAYVELTQDNSNLGNLDNSRNWGRSEWNNEVDSFWFSPLGVNPYSGRQLGGCRVCLYDRTHWNGRWKCVNGGQVNKDLGEGDFDFDDTATSIDFQTADCPKGLSLIATLFQDDDFGGSRLYMEESDNNFGRFERSWNKIWNDSVTSMKVNFVRTSSLNCRVCLYSKGQFQGKKFCTSGSIGDLGDYSFNDATSSIKVFADKSCMGGGVTVYQFSNGEGDQEQFFWGRDESSLGDWDDKITSLVYNPKLRPVHDTSLPPPVGPNKWFPTTVEALDISAGPDGLVWIIDKNNNPKVRMGKQSWSTRGRIKGKRIDAGPNGTAWMVGTDDYLYSWTGTAWKRLGIKKVTDVGVGPAGTVWIVSGDSGDMRPRPLGGNTNKPDHYKIYHWNGSRWIKVDRYAWRIDADEKDNAWFVAYDKSGPGSYTRFVPRVPGSVSRAPVFGGYAGKIMSDVSIGANGTVVVATDAPWVLNGTRWDRVHGRGYIAISVDRNGDLWGVSSRESQPKEYKIYSPRPKYRIHGYGNAMTNAVAAPAAAAPKVSLGKKWQTVTTANKMLDISVGPAGDAWAIGFDNRIYTWNGTGWTKRNEKTPNNQVAKGTRIDVGPEGKVWMVGTDQFPYAFNGKVGGVWEKKGNRTVSDIGVGADGTVWAIGSNPNAPLKWRDSNWQRRTGVNDFGVLRIDVGPQGEGWVVGKSGKVFSRPNSMGSWRAKEIFTEFGKRPPPPVLATDISIGANGTAMIAAKEGGVAIWDETKRDWTKSGSNTLRPVNIAAAASDKGVPWMVEVSGIIWSYKDAYKTASQGPPPGWTPPGMRPPPPPPPTAKASTSAGQGWRALSGNPRALDISAGPDGFVWAIDPDGSPKVWTGTRWDKKTGKGTRIDAGPNNTAWLVGTDKYPYSWTGTAWNKEGNKKVIDVSIGAKGHVWVVGTDGNAYQGQGTSWKKRGTGNWTRIDVDLDGNVWAVSIRGMVAFWTGRQWTQRQPNNGQLVFLAGEISAGAGRVMITGRGIVLPLPPYMKNVPQQVGFGVFSWQNNAWKPSSSPSPLLVVSIAVDKNGNPWATLPGNVIVAVKDASDVRPPPPVPAGQRWRTVSGAALDISAGPEGFVWAIDSDHSPKVWTGTKWNKKPGKKGTRIEAGPNGTAWMVGKDKYLYSWSWTDATWNKVGGKQVIDIGIGAQGQVWVVGTDGIAYLKESTGWVKKTGTGRLLRIDVDPRGNAWAVTGGGMIFSWNGNKWNVSLIMVGMNRVKAADISVGATGRVMVTGIGSSGGSAGGRGIFGIANNGQWGRWSSPVGYDVANIKVHSITVDKNGYPWVTTPTNRIHAINYASDVRPPYASDVRPPRNEPEDIAQIAVAMPKPAAPAASKKWQTMAGEALDISVGPAGAVWAIDPDGSPKVWTGTGWNKITGKGTRIDVGPGGFNWLVGTDRRAYFWRGNRWNGPIPKTVSDIAISANGRAWAIGTDDIAGDAGNHSVYRFTGKWETVPGASGVRIDADANGNAWVVNAKGEVVTSTGRLPVANIKWKPLPNKPPPANDIGIGVNGTVWVALQGGGTALRRGTAWGMRGPKKLSTNVAVNQNGDPWVTTDKQAIWAFK